eukprot:UN02494
MRLCFFFLNLGSNFCWKILLSSKSFSFEIWTTAVKKWEDVPRKPLFIRTGKETLNRLHF